MLSRFSSLILLIVLAFAANAQNGKTNDKQPSAKKTVECKSNDVSFHCPKDLKVLFTDEATGLLLLTGKEKNETFGLFLIAPRESLDEQQLKKIAFEPLLANLYTKEKQSYEWKQTEDMSPGNSKSKHQIGNGAVLGFNSNQAIQVNYRHILFKEKHIWVGYVYELEKGSAAKEAFENELFGYFPVGCENTVEIIGLITGDKFEGKEPPCSLTLIQQANITLD